MSIRLKSYFSGTVEAAMALARKEMGEDAMLIHSRLAQPAARHLGTYEVVFGLYPGAEEADEPEPEPRRPRNGEAQWEITAGGQDSLAQQVAALRQEMERMAQLVAQQTSLDLPKTLALTSSPSRREQPGPESAAMQGPAPVEETQEEAQYRLLVEQELDPALAREVSQGRRLEDTFEVNATLGREGSPRVIVAVVGPPGAGKTTTLAKLAARYGLQQRKRVHLLSIDVLRIGASEQLRTLASLLGIGFGLAETPLDLDRMIEEQYKKDLILIDTPGLGKADMEDGMELAQMIGSDPDIDTHVVLPASMRSADLSRQFHQFRPFHPRKVIFTRLDEASRYGALLSLAAESGLPLSFLTQGQKVPDDLEPATKERLLERLGISLHSEPEQPELGRGVAA